MQRSLENMEKLMFSGVYKNRRILVTGHTGFKGSWLVLWLKILGAKVTGLSLAPETTPNHWALLDLGIESHLIDIRNGELLRAKIKEIRPEIIFHLAAQSLVHRSYQNPIETWTTNVLGTANLLDSCRQLEELMAIIVVTSDKCYENNEWTWGYREIDPLGGHDPYSASKAGSELVVASYRRSFLNSSTSPLLSSARAGNVIGGGDWSENRLIPDLVRSVKAGKSLEIRSPNATRPWQHVLECLSGYLMLGKQLAIRDETYAQAWNFGPDRAGNRQVKHILGMIKEKWPAIAWHCGNQVHPHEAQLLHLDSSNAREKLAWRPVWTLDEGISATVEWYRAWLEEGEIISLDQLQNYMKKAEINGLLWAENISS